MLANGQLSDTVGPLFVLASGQSVKMKTILFFNGDSATRIVTLHLVPNVAGSLGTATDANRVFNEALGPGQLMDFSPPFPVDFASENDSFQASADASAVVNYFMLGVLE